MLTRIVEVVPESLLALIGLLGALTLAFGAVSAVAGRRAHRLERERRRLSADVGLLQSALLPELPETIGATAVSAAYRPAGGGAAGGGFYDAFALPNGRTGVVVGQIRDGGREALAHATLVRYTLRAQLENGLEPRMALRAADRVLLHQLRGHVAQAAVALFDPATGYLTYACAGHPQPLITGGGHAPVDALESPPLGSGLRTGSRQTAVPLGPGRSAVFASLDAGRPPVASASDAPAAGDILRGLDSSDRDTTVLVLRPEGHCPDPPAASYEQLEVRGADWRCAGAFLDALAMDHEETSRVLHEGRDAILRAGAALLEVRRDADGVRASVEETRQHAQATADRSAPRGGRGAGRWTSAAGDDRRWVGARPSPPE